jgi:hypothetical protein
MGYGCPGYLPWARVSARWPTALASPARAGLARRDNLVAGIVNNYQKINKKFSLYKSIN